jgi:hypothetical protein
MHTSAYVYSNSHLVTILPLLVASSLFMTSLSIMTTNAFASTLSKEDPPLLIEEAGSQNQSTDELDIDITIDPTEPLPPNGTQQISTEGATDIDINSFPPSNVTILIDNETVYVTNRPVTLGN